MFALRTDREWGAPKLRMGLQARKKSSWYDLLIATRLI